MPLGAPIVLKLICLSQDDRWPVMVGPLVCEHSLSFLILSQAEFSCFV